MRKAREVNVILTWDRDCRDEELFDLTGLVMRNLEKEGEAAAIPVGSPLPSKAPALLLLSLLHCSFRL